MNSLTPSNLRPTAFQAFFLFVSVVIGFLFGCSPLSAHPDLIEQISSLNRAITAAPTNSDLYLRRADIFRLHEEFRAAHADLAVVEKLQPGSEQLPIVWVEVLYDESKPSEALQIANKYVHTYPKNAGLLALRAKCWLKLKKRAEAVADLSAAIGLFPAPSPDLLLLRAKTQADSHDFEAAVAGLDEGIGKLGAVPSLELAAVQYQRQQKRFPEALARVDRLVARYPVPEPWLVLRGEILEEAGDNVEAANVFRKVLAGLEQYPPHRRGLGITRQIEERARRGLSRLRVASGKPATVVSAEIR